MPEDVSKEGRRPRIRCAALFERMAAATGGPRSD
jgi:hypothetical protein